MSVLAPLFRSLENPQTSLSNPGEWLYDALGGGRNSSGERVNAKTALHYSPIWRGLNLICTTLAKTPIHLYERKGAGSDKERATDDPRYQCLRYRPCEEYTDYRWKLTMFWRALLRGNSVAYIFDKGRQTQEYVPLDPMETYIFREGTQLFYMTKVGERDVRMMPDEVLHFTGWGDGPIGLSLIEHASECIGLGLAQQKHASVFYKNGMKASVVLEYPGRIGSDAEYEKLLERYRQAHSGAANMEKPLLLQGGMTSKPWVVSGRDAQFIEQRKFGIREAANFLNLPAYKLGDDARTSFASLEQSNQEFIDESIDPHMAMAEAEFREKLSTPEEKKNDTLIVEFHRQSLMRTDFQSRQNGYRTALAGRPYMLPDEVRAMENMPPLPEGVGSTYLDPLNMGNLGGDPEDEPVKPDAPQMKPAKEKPADDTSDNEDDSRMRDALLFVVRKTATRVCTRAQKRTAKALTAAEHDEIRDALAPYCIHAHIDLDGATTRILAIIQAEPDTEFTNDTLAARIAAA